MQKGKTILIARNAFSYGGAEKATLLLAEQLLHTGHNPIVVTNVTELRDMCTQSNIKYSTVLWMCDRVGGKKYLAKYLFGGIIIFFQYVLLILRCRPSTLLLDSKDDQVFGSFAARLFGLRVVWRDHGGISRDWLGASMPFDRIYFAALRSATTLVTISKANEKLLRKQLPTTLHSKIRVIYGGVDTNYYESQKDINVPTITIGMIGRVVADKGVDIFLDAAKTLAANNPALKFSITGDGPDIASYKTTVKDYSIPVVFYPFSPDVRLSLNRIDIFVAPTKAESLGLAILEAMSYKRIVIASNVGGIPEIIEDNQSGFLCEPNAHDLIEAIQKVIVLPKADLLSLGVRARQRVQSKFELKVNNEVLTSLLI